MSSPLPSVFSVSVFCVVLVVPAEGGAPKVRPEDPEVVAGGFPSTPVSAGLFAEPKKFGGEPLFFSFLRLVVEGLDGGGVAKKSDATGAARFDLSLSSAVFSAGGAGAPKENVELLPDPFEAGAGAKLNLLVGAADFSSL